MGNCCSGNRVDAKEDKLTNPELRKDDELMEKTNKPRAETAEDKAFKEMAKQIKSHNDHVNVFEIFSLAE